MLVCPILFLFTVLPISDWAVNGQLMMYSELWRSGAGVALLVFVGLGLIGCWGMAARKGWSRWALVFVPLLPFATFPRYLIQDFGATLFGGLFTAVIFYLCLFHLKVVRNYFDRIN